MVKDFIHLNADYQITSLGMLSIEEGLFEVGNTSLLAYYLIENKNYFSTKEDSSFVHVKGYVCDYQYKFDPTSKFYVSKVLPLNSEQIKKAEFLLENLLGIGTQFYFDLNN